MLLRPLNVGFGRAKSGEAGPGLRFPMSDHNRRLNKLVFDDRSDPLHRNRKNVPHAAFGPDDARRAGVRFELASEAKNLHIDAAVKDILVKTGCLQQVLAT